MARCEDCGCTLITRDEKLSGICDDCYYGWDDYWDEDDYWF